MSLDKTIIQELNENHIAIPYKFNPKSNNCCFNFLTSWNYLWTTDVTLLSNEDSEQFQIIYGSGRNPVQYHTLIKDGENIIQFIGELGNGTNTEFERIYINIDRIHTLSVYKIPSIMMTYNRFGAQSQFILINRKYVKDYALDIIINDFGSSSKCFCSPCIRTEKTGNIEKREKYDHTIFGKIVN